MIARGLNVQPLVKLLAMGCLLFVPLNSPIATALHPFLRLTSLVMIPITDLHRGIECSRLRRLWLRSSTTAVSGEVE
jgi:hypothetical protein